MSNNIRLKKGLDIPVAGTAALQCERTVIGDVVAVSGCEFRALVPRLLVKEGDSVLCGTPILADKKRPEILFTSPVSGTVVEINEALEDQPELINEDAFENWIIKVSLSDKSELDALMNAAAYEAFCEK